MKACVLASGSKGNVCYVKTKNHNILIDIGTNKKYIVEKLKNINILPEDIDIILISHLHKDHISALNTFVNIYKPTICITKKMFEEMDSINNYPFLYIYEDDIELEDITIKTIKSSHDVTDSRNFIIEEDGKSIVYITDTGYIRHKYFKDIANKNLYLLESNHDIEMLSHGPYPEWLKSRVISDEGHLSNQSAGFYLSKLIGNNTKEVVLMHLSEVNNTESIALATVNDVLREYNIDFKNITCAKQNENGEVIEV